jgi:hypothetical protein
MDKHSGDGDERGVVPRKMLSLCRDLLRLCLAERIAVEDKLRQALERIAELERELGRRRRR